MKRFLVLNLFSLLAAMFLTVPALADETELDGFNSRMRVMEEAISARAGNIPGQIAAYNTLEAALKRELDRAFDRVMTQMKPSQRANMTQSQHLWDSHRDAEFKWMDLAHSPVEPNSIEHLSILQLRNLMLNARVIQLYTYLNTLPIQGVVKPVRSRDTDPDSGGNDLKVATFRGFSLGDGACFLDLFDEDRKPFTEVADTAFCQRESELLDKKVSLTYRLGSLSSAACLESRGACDDNNMLIMVVDAKPIRPSR